MRLKVLLFAVLLATGFVYAQEPNYEEVVTSNQNDPNSIYELTNLESRPEFPEGMSGLMKFLSANMKYPVSCYEERVQGRVLVRFTVFTNGSVGNISVVKSVHPLLDAEAVRVVSMMPKWNPGILSGKPVNVWYTLPVNFKLH